MPIENDDDTIAAFYYGTTIHNSFDGMFEIMEYKMHVNPFTGSYNVDPNFEPEGKQLYKWVSGSLDAIYNNETIIDFKTCTKIPPKPLGQYVKQINFYSYMYWLHTGIDIKKGAILYLEKTSGFKKTKLFEFDLLDKDIIKDLMCYSLDVLSKDLSPDRNITYACKWCPYIDECDPHGNP